MVKLSVSELDQANIGAKPESCEYAELGIYFEALHFGRYIGRPNIPFIKNVGG